MLSLLHHLGVTSHLRVEIHYIPYNIDPLDYYDVMDPLLEVSVATYDKRK
jgi:hypothetical protein